MDRVSSSRLEELLDVGIALSSTRDLETLLTLILSEVCRFTTADGGTLYLVEGDSLRAEIAQCQTFIDRWGEEQASTLFTSFTLPINTDSIAGAAAFTREVVNIADVQNPASAAPFRYHAETDRKFGYSTHSNLAIPMLDREGEVIGVLQLINAQEAGRICPFDAARVKLGQALASQAAVAIKNTQLTESLLHAHLDTLYRLGVAAEWRDKETANHIARVSHYSAVIAAHLGWSEKDIDLILHASPMHDVGKLGVPDAILQKPGRLDEEEYRIMQTHAIIGANILKKADNPVMRMARIIALNHHERWDGRGYPHGLIGQDIPQAARIVGLVDVYDALSSQRCYKPAFPEEQVVAILRQETGAHFDPQAVEALWDKLDWIREISHRYADSARDLERFRSYDSIVLEE